MRKWILGIIILLYVFSWVSAAEINIISREEWWANKHYNAIESHYWKNILREREQKQKSHSLSEEEKKKKWEKQKKINTYLNNNFSEYFSLSETKRFDPDTWVKLAWPYKYSNFVDSIIIHHTSGEYKSNKQWLEKIHKFHSLSREWGDIWYNYIIWYDGEIYEGRAWWDYSVGAHSKYNNIGSVWIAIIGNYEEKDINPKQYASLKNLIVYLTKKYGIDLNKKRYYHMKCSKAACDTFPIETYLDNRLVWHRDTGHTSCPWEKLYAQIQEIRRDLAPQTKWYEIIKRWEEKINNRYWKYSSSDIQKILKVLQNYTVEEKEKILGLIDLKISDNSESEKYKNKLKIIKLAVLLSQ